MSEENAVPNNQRLLETRQVWDAAAITFDNEPDHGLRDPRTLAAWTALLKSALPSTSGAVLDIGCGTGSLSLVLAKLGFTVTGIDLSPAMLEQAKTKALAAGCAIEFHAMDASFPQLPPQHYDAILCRHLLWALPDPDQVLKRWVNLLKPAGRLILIEGFWHTGAGLHAQQIQAMLPPSLINVTVQNLSDQPDLWGGAVSDERYIITADLPSQS